MRALMMAAWLMGGAVVVGAGACDGSPVDPTTTTTTAADATDATATMDAADAATATDAATETATDDATVASGADAVGDAAVDDPPNPLGARLTFAIEPITIQPGTERQVCKVVNIPSGDGAQAIDVVRIESRMAGASHHFNVYKVLDEDKLKPATEAEGKVHDCSPASEQLRGDAAYIYGSAQPDRVMETPTGVAFHLEPGQRLILEYHGLDYTTAPVQGGVEIDLVTAGGGARIEHWADIMWLANWGFVLPEGEEHSDTASCAMPYDVEVFMLMSHFHELGTHFGIDAVRGGVATHVYDSEDWAHPEVEAFDPPLELRMGDEVQWTCTWFNWRDHDVHPAKSSLDEMCMVFAGAYPKNEMSDVPFQCNVVF